MTHRQEGHSGVFAAPGKRGLHKKHFAKARRQAEALLRAGLGFVSKAFLGTAASTPAGSQQVPQQRKHFTS